MPNRKDEGASPSAEPFDPYREWLGVSKLGVAATRPDHFALLGVLPSEDDDEVIHQAALARMERVRMHQAGKRSEIAVRVLREIAEAGQTLGDRSRRQQYRQTLTKSAPAIAAETESVDADTRSESVEIELDVDPEEAVAVITNRPSDLAAQAPADTSVPPANTDGAKPVPIAARRVQGFLVGSAIAALAVSVYFYLLPQAPTPIEPAVQLKSELPPAASGAEAASNLAENADSLFKRTWEEECQNIRNAFADYRKARSFTGLGQLDPTRFRGSADLRAILSAEAQQIFADKNLKLNSLEGRIGELRNKLFQQQQMSATVLSASGKQTLETATTTVNGFAQEALALRTELPLFWEQASRHLEGEVEKLGEIENIAYGRSPGPLRVGEKLAHEWLTSANPDSRRLAVLSLARSRNAAGIHHAKLLAGDANTAPPDRASALWALAECQDTNEEAAAIARLAAEPKWAALAFPTTITSARAAPAKWSVVLQELACSDSLTDPTMAIATWRFLLENRPTTPMFFEKLERSLKAGALRSHRERILTDILDREWRELYKTTLAILGEQGPMVLAGVSVSKIQQVGSTHPNLAQALAFNQMLLSTDPATGTAYVAVLDAGGWNIPSVMTSAFLAKTIPSAKAIAPLLDSSNPLASRVALAMLQGPAEIPLAEIQPVRFRFDAEKEPTLTAALAKKLWEGNATQRRWALAQAFSPEYVNHLLLAQRLRQRSLTFVNDFTGVVADGSKTKINGEVRLSKAKWKIKLTEMIDAEELLDTTLDGFHERNERFRALPPSLPTFGVDAVALRTALLEIEHLLEDTRRLADSLEDMEDKGSNLLLSIESFDVCNRIHQECVERVQALRQVEGTFLRCFDSQTPVSAIAPSAKANPGGLRPPARATKRAPVKRRR